MKVFLGDDSNFPCDCTGSQFMDKDHNLTLTGNLKIINNNKLREHFSEGSKQPECKIPYYQEAQESITTGVKSRTQFYCDKQGVTKLPFSEWKRSKISAIAEKTSYLFTKLRTIKSKNTLKLNDDIITEELKTIYNKSSAVFTDMARGNNAFFCQRHYTHVLLE